MDTSMISGYHGVEKIREKKEISDQERVCDIGNHSVDDKGVEVAKQMDDG